MIGTNSRQRRQFLIELAAAGAANLLPPLLSDGALVAAARAAPYDPRRTASAFFPWSWAGVVALSGPKHILFGADDPYVKIAEVDAGLNAVHSRRRCVSRSIARMRCRSSALQQESLSASLTA